MEILKKLRNNEGKLSIFTAPICGFSRYPFRLVLQNFPADLIFTEMVSIDALYYQNPKTFNLLQFEPGKTPTAVQLVGSKEDYFLTAIEKIGDMGFESFDINLGCPVKKVIKNHAGSYLLKNPKKVYQIFNLLNKNFPHLIFTAKVRLGFSEIEKNYLDIAKALEDGGAKIITVHGRTRTQMYSGDVDLSAIKEIKNQVNIPVIGNGNIFTPEDAQLMVKKTNCDGIMLARGIIGNPWLISQIKDFLNKGTYSAPSLKERLLTLKENLNLELSFDPLNGFREFKKMGVKYLKGIKGASEFRNKIIMCKDSLEMQQVVNNLIQNYN